MPLKLFNTLSRKLEDFIPLKPGEAGMYTCGPTVYNFAHIGNLRTYLFEDLLRRTLHLSGYKVTHVCNITDVGHLTSDEDTGEDKMEAGARREGRSVWDIAAFYTAAFMKDIADLNIVPATAWPRATDHIKEQVAMVQALLDKGYAYTIADGIYYDTSKFPAYGHLARKDVEGQEAGARVQQAEGKRNAPDFALWKFSPKDQQRLMEWDSPWGRGFPGWHLECSAMSRKYLGDQFDIHCGGIDHIPVHHTNEIAQTEAVTGKAPWVKYWLHGEFLILDKGKMSKSAGGFLTLAGLREKGYEPLDYRYLCLNTHYRAALCFSFDSLDQARTGRANLMQRLDELVGVKAVPDGEAQALPLWARFLECLHDDLNAPRALAVVWEAAKDTSLSPAQKAGLIREMDRCLGLDLLKHRVRRDQGALSADEQKLFDDRVVARKNKDWKKSDELRDELAKRGIRVMDKKDGAGWERAL